VAQSAEMRRRAIGGLTVGPRLATRVTCWRRPWQSRTSGVGGAWASDIRSAPARGAERLALRNTAERCYEGERATADPPDGGDPEQVSTWWSPKRSETVEE